MTRTRGASPLRPFDVIPSSVVEAAKRLFAAYRAQTTPAGEERTVASPTRARALSR